MKGDNVDMKKKIFNFAKVFSALNALALMVVAQSANAACLWVFHQPKFPETAKKYSKSK